MAKMIKTKKCPRCGTKNMDRDEASEEKVKTPNNDLKQRREYRRFECGYSEVANESKIGDEDPVMNVHTLGRCKEDPEVSAMIKGRREILERFEMQLNSSKYFRTDKTFKEEIFRMLRELKRDWASLDAKDKDRWY